MLHWEENKVESHATREGDGPLLSLEDKGTHVSQC